MKSMKCRTVVTTKSGHVYNSPSETVDNTMMVEYKERIKRAMKSNNFNLDLPDGEWITFKSECVESVKIEVTEHQHLKRSEER